MRDPSLVMRELRQPFHALTRWLALALVVIAAPSGLARQTSALDLEAHFEFKIAPQKLTTALVELSRQANATVVSDTKELDRFESPGISGRMSLKRALSALLEGTDLEYTVTDQGVIAVGASTHRRPKRGRPKL